MATMMRDAAISFPMFGDFTINPSASFELFGRTFYWYGVLIALGFLLAITYCARRAPDFGLKADDLYDLVIWVLPIGVICARLYFVAFQWDNYKDNLISILYIWEGGLAIYGGVIGGAVTAILWCRKKKIPMGAALDLLAMGVLIGQIMGRWGNFMNREAFGAVTDVFCRMGLTRPGMETVYVHPTFLYESLWNLVGLIALHFFTKKGKRKYDGQGFILYLFWYGLGRVWIEGLRTDSLYLWGSGVRVSQALAGISALVALAILVINSRRPHPPLFADKPHVQTEVPEETPAESADK